MENKIFTVAIIGCGSRGAMVYGENMFKAPEKFKIVCLCDASEMVANYYANYFGVPSENVFYDEDEFFKVRRADFLVIGTQDALHIRHATKAYMVGYDILLEKPISDNEQECLDLLELQKKTGCITIVGHVFRYAPGFVKVKELLDAGEIGKLQYIDGLERVQYQHFCRSYVRGPWRNSEMATPIILAKCCHDLDLMQFYANSKCETVSCVGDLDFFNQKNAPEGSAEYCLDCKHKETCLFSAYTYYIKRWKEEGCPEQMFPHSKISTFPITEEKLVKALSTQSCGKCAFRSDNNVPDNLSVNMRFANGVKGRLLMQALTAKGSRRYTFYGTKGQITYEGQGHKITVEKFGQEKYEIDVNELILAQGVKGHSGGDIGLINALYPMLSNNATASTSLQASIESHIMGIRAEQSRLQGGVPLKVHND
ncbi:MAG: Gfo/Idh/MocA family oxidoreductase [Clostridia bacterium]|nr:Gfo/Idh/MocA family oxidoreductase [Clostridia bacterium]